MHHFSEFLAIQHLNVPHLRGRTGTCKGVEEAAGEKKIGTGGTKTKREPSRLKKSKQPEKSEQAIKAAEAEPTGRKRPELKHGRMWSRA